MKLRASLPMYDLPEVRDSTDRLWAAIAQEMRDAGIAAAPEVLERPRDHHDAWLAPGLLLSQSCGYPVARSLRGVLRVVATPHYAAPGCEGHRYSSAVVVRVSSCMTALDAMRGAVCAFNSRDSQSGYNALRALIAPISGGAPFFSDTIETGAHAASIEAVRSARADVCAVDCVTWALHARHRPSSVAGLEVLCRTQPAPGLPLVTAADRTAADFAAIRRALERAFTRPDLALVRDALLISGISATTDDAYAPLLEMERAAVESGYPTLE